MLTKFDRTVRALGSQVLGKQRSLFGASGQALSAGGTPMVSRCDYRDGTCNELRVRLCNRCHGGYSA